MARRRSTTAHATSSSGRGGGSASTCRSCISSSGWVWVSPGGSSSVYGEEHGRHQEESQQTSVFVEDSLQVRYAARLQEREPQEHAGLLRVLVERGHEAEAVVFEFDVTAHPSHD